MTEALNQTDVLKERHRETVWHKRAARLSRRPLVAETGEESWPVIVLGIGTDRYGVELSDVKEVLPTVRAMPVPGAPKVYAGVINVRGEIRAVLDLRRLLGMDALPEGDHPRIILLSKGGRQMGLQIDRVEQIRSIGSKDLQPGGQSDSPRHIKGLTTDLLMLIDTEALFAELQRGIET